MTDKDGTKNAVPAQTGSSNGKTSTDSTPGTPAATTVPTDGGGESEGPGNEAPAVPETGAPPAPASKPINQIITRPYNALSKRGRELKTPETKEPKTPPPAVPDEGNKDD